MVVWRISGRKLLMASLGLMSGNWKLRRVTGEIAY
jgi:hypothetical protein